MDDVKQLIALTADCESNDNHGEHGESRHGAVDLLGDPQTCNVAVTNEVRGVGSRMDDGLGHGRITDDLVQDVETLIGPCGEESKGGVLEAQEYRNADVYHR